MMYQHAFNSFSLGALFCLLTACSTTSETFDCKEGIGVGCQPLSAINQMVDEGRLGMIEDEPSIITRQGSAFQQLEFPLSDSLVVHRIKEEPLRVWIAPFQDAQGNLHEGSVVYTVLKPGFWRIEEAR